MKDKEKRHFAELDKKSGRIGFLISVNAIVQLMVQRWKHEQKSILIELHMKLQIRSLLVTNRCQRISIGLSPYSTVEFLHQITLQNTYKWCSSPEKTGFDREFSYSFQFSCWIFVENYPIYMTFKILSEYLTSRKKLVLFFERRLYLSLLIDQQCRQNEFLEQNRNMKRSQVEHSFLIMEIFQFSISKYSLLTLSEQIVHFFQLNRFYPLRDISKLIVIFDEKIVFLANNYTSSTE